MRPEESWGWGIPDLGPSRALVHRGCGHNLLLGPERLVCRAGPAHACVGSEALPGIGGQGCLLRSSLESSGSTWPPGHSGVAPA